MRSSSSGSSFVKGMHGIGLRDAVNPGEAHPTTAAHTTLQTCRHVLLAQRLQLRIQLQQGLHLWRVGPLGAAQVDSPLAERVGFTVVVKAQRRA